MVASFYASHASRSPVPVAQYRSYDYERAPDPAGELTRALGDLAGGPGAIGVEASSLPTAVADVLRAQGGVLVPVDDLVVAARRIKLPVELDAIRRASHLSDVVQAAVKELAQPGMSEAEVAAEAQARMAKEAGRRVPAILTVTTGEATSTGGWEATDRIIQAGDLVLCDTSPWIDGHWSDSANAVCAGTPTRRSAPHLRPRPARRSSSRSSSAHRVRCRATSTPRCAPSSPTSEPPIRITPATGSARRGRSLPASRPTSAFRSRRAWSWPSSRRSTPPGFGGIRLEHVFVVRAGGNETLTRFEHTL